MDRLTFYRETVKRVLLAFVGRIYSNPEILNHSVFDEQNDHYLVMRNGWDGKNGTRRMHGCLLHLDIINGQIWIQRDGTEDGIADALLAAGVPKEDIVLGFHSAGVRPLTGFGVGAATELSERIPVK